MFATLLNVILPVFVVVGCGYLAAKAKLISADQIDGLMKFAQGIAIPVLLFRAMSTLDFEASFDLDLLTSFYVGAAACFTLGLLGARFVFGRAWEDSVVIGFCCLFSNSMLLGIAITERAYGASALVGNFVIIAVHSPFCYTLGITVMEILRNRDKGGLRIVSAVLQAIFKNALIIGILAGLALNFSGLTLPEAVDDGLALLATAGLPAALFALGGIMVRYRPEGDLRIIAMVCALALLGHPVITWSLGTAYGISTEFFRSAVLTSAMAPGINGYIFANMYGRAKRVAASSVLIATALSVFTVMIWLTLLP